MSSLESEASRLLTELRILVEESGAAAASPYVDDPDYIQQYLQYKQVCFTSELTLFYVEVHLQYVEVHRNNYYFLMSILVEVYTRSLHKKKTGGKGGGGAYAPIRKLLNMSSFQPHMFYLIPESSM